MSTLKRCFSLYTKLGRWKIEHDVKIINIKIDQANRDNSGTYEKETIKEINKEVNKELKDEFLLPYYLKNLYYYKFLCHTEIAQNKHG